MKITSIFLAFLSLLCSTVAQAQMSISWPVNRAVFQRAEYGGQKATIYVAGQCLVANTDYQLQLKATKLNISDGSYNSITQDWSTFAYSRPYGGLYKTSISLFGGWYKIEIRAVPIGSAGVLASAEVKVGVGEVYVIAGQSNAQGVTETSTYYQSPYDGVVADLHLEDCSDDIPQFPNMLPLYIGYPIAPQGKTNWCYTVLGNQIADQNSVPVAFFNAAQFGTSVYNWVQSSDGSGTENIFSRPNLVCLKPGHPYTPFKNTLNFYTSLFGTRAILWHQGESDNQLGTSQSDYENYLNALISTSRTHLGNSNLAWYISRATYFATAGTIQGRNGVNTWQPVVNAQSNVASSNRYGPETDNLQIPRGDNFVHFGGTGLFTLGEAWKNKNLTNNSPVGANSMPDLQVTKNGDGTFTLTAQGGFSNYYWVSGDNRLIPSGSNATVLSTNQTYSSLTSGFYRYYAKNSQGAGNYVVSQKIYLPLPSGSARLAADEAIFEEDYGYSLKVSPNPVQEQAIIEVKLPIQAKARLELLNTRGEVVKVIADNPHAAGTYRYPVSLAHLTTGTYYCRLQADDLFITKKLIKASR